MNERVFHNRGLFHALSDSLENPAPSWRISISELVFLVVAVLTAQAALASTASRFWTLQTDDTEMRLGVMGDRPFIQSLRSKGDGHDWLAVPTPLPLMERVWLGEKSVLTAWQLQQVQISSGSSQLTFYFTNAEPKMALRSI